MLKKLLKNTKFKLFFKEYEKELLDIILFGSTLKGKTNPNDIDILLLFKEKINLDLSYEFKKKFSEFNLSITDKKYVDLFDSNFIARESYLSEGYSLVYNKKISEGLGYLNLILFRYELKGFSKSDRIRFHYSLYGRNKKDSGIVDNLNLIKFSDSVILCPVDKYDFFKEHLDYWNIKYLDFPVLIPLRLKNSLLQQS